MRKSLRPYVTAGIALVGASVLAVAPVIATPPDVTIANPDVALSASPIDPYLAIFARARTNAEALLEAAMNGAARRGTSRGHDAAKAVTGGGDNDRDSAGGSP